MWCKCYIHKQAYYTRIHSNNGKCNWEVTTDWPVGFTFFFNLIDETTDVAVVEELSTDEKVHTVLTVETPLAYLQAAMIPFSRLVGFASDGASVMVGKHSGVATQLKTMQPILTSIHCVAHRLALAAGQAGEKIKFIALGQLFYFYENSAVRLSALKEI